MNKRQCVNYGLTFFFIIGLFAVLGSPVEASVSTILTKCNQKNTADCHAIIEKKLTDPLHILPKQALQSLKKNITYEKKIPSFKDKLLTGGLVALKYLLIAMVLSGGIPVVIFFIQYNLTGLHAFCNHYRKCRNYLPRVAIIIPAWNEGAVLPHTLGLLLKIDYPLSALRIYVIDDGSTDNTQEILTQMQQSYPENIVNIKKLEGGKGKSHTLNYGLDVILSDDWAEAIMIIDADISFKKDALRRMTRHLADPEVGAVTAYIKEGTRRHNYINRSIAYEYIASQSIARRTQNVLGVVACLAGGAQLHSRKNIEALGGKINTSTLAEDTYTTLETQRMGRKVIYEGNAFVYAEEPNSIVGVWKQRFRWARGNIQITHAFQNIWFRPSKISELGSVIFGVIWFSVLLMPIFMVLSSVGLLGLFFIDKKLSFDCFSYLMTVSLFVYLYSTLFSLIADRRTSRLAVFEGVFYPGLISLLLLLIAVNPPFFLQMIHASFHEPSSFHFSDFVLLFIETWSGFCMFWAWLVYRLDLIDVSPKITNILLLIVGYGPLLCAVYFAAYVAEMKKMDLRWDKTEKRGGYREVRNHPDYSKPFDFDEALHKDILREYRMFMSELLSLAIVIGLFLIFFPNYK